VAQDAPVFDFGYIALEDVQIGAADRHRVDADDRVFCVAQCRLGDVAPRVAAKAVVAECLHDVPLKRLVERAYCLDERVVVAVAEVIVHADNAGGRAHRIQRGRDERSPFDLAGQGDDRVVHGDVDGRGVDAELSGEQVLEMRVDRFVVAEEGRAVGPTA
jgi:hypothetical protein